jgi:hypothetical protein
VIQVEPNLPEPAANEACAPLVTVANGSLQLCAGPGARVEVHDTEQPGRIEAASNDVSNCSMRAITDHPQIIDPIQERKV